MCVMREEKLQAWVQRRGEGDLCKCKRRKSFPRFTHFLRIWLSSLLTRRVSSSLVWQARISAMKLRRPRIVCLDCNDAILPAVFTPLRYGNGHACGRCVETVRVKSVNWTFHFVISFHFHFHSLPPHFSSLSSYISPSPSWLSINQLTSDKVTNNGAHWPNLFWTFLSLLFCTQIRRNECWLTQRSRWRDKVIN